MSRRSWIIIGASLALLAVACEVYFWRLNATRAGVQIINETGAAIEGLTISFADNRFEVGRLIDGGSAYVRVHGSSKGTLLLDYQQKGNPIAGFQIAEFDPVYLGEGKFKMVLTIKPGQIERIMEDDEASSTPRSWATRLLRGIEDELRSAN